MERFIRCQKVERYRRLLERVTEEPDRPTILKLLSEEQKKQKRRPRSNLISLVGKLIGSAHCGGSGLCAARIY
jgi:hypothetical protein